MVSVAGFRVEKRLPSFDQVFRSFIMNFMHKYHIYRVSSGNLIIDESVPDGNC